jgi:hypothetical protein
MDVASIYIPMRVPGTKRKQQELSQQTRAFTMHKSYDYLLRHCIGPKKIRKMGVPCCDEQVGSDCEID